MVLRSIIILLLVSLNTGATVSPYSESNGPVSLRSGWSRLSSVITEEGLGIIQGGQGASACHRTLGPEDLQ